MTAAIISQPTTATQAPAETSSPAITTVNDVLPYNSAQANGIHLSFVTHYRSGNSTRRPKSLAKRMRRCILCAKSPKGICGRHSKETRRSA